MCWQVVYKRLEMIQLTAPYIPGFLAFREVSPSSSSVEVKAVKRPLRWIASSGESQTITSNHPHKLG